MNYTDIILGNDKALKKDAIVALINVIVFLVLLIVLFVLGRGISLLLVLLIGVVAITGISKLRAVGACKIELKDTEFVVVKRGIMGTSIKTYEKNKVENFHILEPKNLKKRNQKRTYEDQQFLVQFTYEKKTVGLFPQQFLGLGQTFSKYFNYPLNENK